MATATDGGATPATAPAADIPAPAAAEARSLEQPKFDDFNQRVAKASNPHEVLQALSEAKKDLGLRLPTQADIQAAAAKKAASEIPPDLQAAAAAEETPAMTTEEAPAETPAEETPATDAAETPEGQEPEDDDAAEDGEEIAPSKAKKLRLRLPENDEVGRLAAAFMQRNRDITMEEAMNRARAKLGVKSPAEAKPDDTQPESAKSKLPQTTESVDAEIQRLRAERKKANAELRFEDASDLSDSLEDLIQHRSDLQRNSEREQARAEQTYNQQWKTAEARAVEIYPDAARADTAFGKRMIEIEKSLEELGDPLFTDPEKPLRIAQMVAREMNIAPKKKGAPVAPAKAAAPVAAPAVKKGILPGGASRTTPPPVNQPPAIQQEIQNIKSVTDLRQMRKKLGLSY